MKILIATDGSDFSAAAIDACRNVVAAPENASFKIVSAVEYPAPPAAEIVLVSAAYYDRLEQTGHARAKELLEQAAARLRALFPNFSLDLTTEVLDGSPPRVVVEKAQEWGADLVVVGSHGYGFWSRALLGSVSSSVVHHAPCSVLVARAAAEAATA